MNSADTLIRLQGWSSKETNSEPSFTFFDMKEAFSSTTSSGRTENKNFINLEMFFYKVKIILKT